MNMTQDFQGYAAKPTSFYVVVVVYKDYSRGPLSSLQIRLIGCNNGKETWSGCDRRKTEWEGPY